MRYKVESNLNFYLQGVGNASKQTYTSLLKTKSYFEYSKIVIVIVKEILLGILGLRNEAAGAGGDNKVFTVSALKENTILHQCNHYCSPHLAGYSVRLGPQ